VKIAYVVSAYKLPEQLVRLVRRLAAPGATFAIHVDAKTDADVVDAMVSGVRGVDGVTFLPRHACYWGGFGHVRASLKGLGHVLRSGAGADYVVLLTGQDYPLEPPAEIERRLAAAEGRSFMTFWPLPHEPWAGRGGLDRIERLHWVRGRRAHLSLPLRRRLPRGLRPFGGSPYWSLARPVAEHVERFVRDRPDVVRFFEHVWIPDEIFFQSVVMSSDLADTVVNDNQRHIDWTRDPAPTIFETRDLDDLASSGALFARKFDVTVDARILDLLDERLRERSG